MEMPSDERAESGIERAVRLDAASVDAVARRVAEILRERSLVPGSGLLTAAEVASRYGVKRGWVYDNAARLGAIRLGRGSKARLRFDPDRVAAQFKTNEPARGPRRPSARPSWLPEADLIPIRGK
jgi:hypothetical protein